MGSGIKHLHAVVDLNSMVAVSRLDDVTSKWPAECHIRFCLFHGQCGLVERPAADQMLGASNQSLDNVMTRRTLQLLTFGKDFDQSRDNVRPCAQLGLRRSNAFAMSSMFIMSAHV